jgi:nucleotide sugar dehydrogenase
MREDRSADTSIVTTAIRQISADLYIIKSTVPPGFTRSLSLEEGTGRKTHVVFSPEYYGGTQHANAPKDFVIFGGDEKDCRKDVQLWQEACTGYSRILTTDFETAELVKYAENTWLASQVVFFNTFWRIAKKIGVDFTNFREALLLDERISRSHSLVYDDHPYYDSHCLNKDLPAIVKASESAGYFPEFIQSIIDCNSAFKTKKPLAKSQSP